MKKTSPRPALRLHPVLFCAFVLFSLILACGRPTFAAPERLVISAHGGDSGPLADTLPGLVLAAQTGVDYIELDLVATSDKKPVLYDSIYLDPETDVATRFPGMARPDGRYYVADFTLDQVRQLRRRVEDNQRISTPALGIPTFEEALALINTLQTRLHKKVGIAPRILSPTFYRKQGIDLSSLVLQTLAAFGYTNSKQQPVLIESEDGDELQRIHKDLLPAMDLDLPLLQRVGENVPQPLPGQPVSGPLPYDFSWMFTRLGLRVISSYAAGIALDSSYLLDSEGKPLRTDYLNDVRDLGLKIFVCSVNDTPASFPSSITSYPALLETYFTTIGVNGVITDSPAPTLAYLRQPIPVKPSGTGAAPLDSDLPPFSFGSGGSGIILNSSSTP